MKNCLCILALCFIAILIAFGIDSTTRCKDVEILLQTERFEREFAEAELEKEIRLLKQDVYALRYGYEGEEGEEK